MAARGWASSVLTAIGVAAGVGAAQLGLGYGLEVIVWKGDSQSAWLSSLAWVLWVAATSTVLGAICAERLSVRGVGSTVDTGRADWLVRLADLGWRTVIALSAAIGAVIVVPLVAVPTQASRHGDGFALQITAAACAVVGVVLGLFVAIGALSTRAITTNVIASVCWIWTLAVVAVIDGVRIGRPTGNAQLAVWSFTDGGWWQSLYLPGALLMLTAALIIGGLAAWPAGRRGDNRIGVAISGATGPALVAVAYLVAAPSLSGLTDEPKSAFVAALVIAPYVVLAGLGGSIVVAALGPKTERIPKAERTPKPERVSKRRKSKAVEQDAITDWSRTLAAVDDASPDDETTATGRVRVDSPVGSKAAGSDTDSRGAELDEDSYAPPRAYTPDPAALAYATDEGDADPPPVTTKAAGRAKPVTAKASPVAPLWPEPAGSTDDTGSSGSGSGPVGKGRSGGSGRRADKGR